MDRIRAKDIAMVFQEPMTSLNPVYTIGEQIAEVLRRHEGLSRKAAIDKTVEMLRLVQIPNPDKRLDDYPHQFSGGMRQRVMIAMALSCSPKLLIADEPTTALDVTIQAQILELLQDMKSRFGMAIMLITHAMGVVAETAQRVVVMYAGKVIEEAPVDAAVRRSEASLHAGPDPLDPAHRYGGDAARRGSRPFRAWCRACSTRRPAAASRRAASYAMPKCREAVPPLLDVGGGHKVACVLHQAVLEMAAHEPSRCLRVKDLTKNFKVGGGFLSRDAARGSRGRQRELRHRAGRNARAGRRIRLGQIDHRPLHPAPDRADRRRGLVRGPQRHASSARPHSARSAATCRSSSRTRSPRSIRA